MIELFKIVKFCLIIFGLYFITCVISSSILSTLIDMMTYIWRANNLCINHLIYIYIDVKEGITDLIAT